MNSFEKLLNIIRQKNSSLITEEQATQLTESYKKSISEIEANAEKCGLAKGYADGFAEGKNAMKPLLKEEFEKGRKSVLANATKSIVSNAEALVNEAIEKCDEEATAKLNVLLEAIDNDYANKLQTVLEAVDNSYANKLQTILETVDKNHTAALENSYNLMSEKNNALKAKYDALVEEQKLDHAKIAEITEENNQLNEAILHKGEECVNQVCEQVDRYLNRVLENKIPTKQIVTESKLNLKTNAINRIIDTLKVEKILEESKNDVIMDYENKLNAAKKEVDRLACENVDLSKKLNKEHASILLESKLSKCTPNEAAYLRNYFKNAENSTVIEEQIEGARLAYKKLYEEKRDASVNSIKNKTNVSKASMISESSVKEQKKESIAVEKKNEAAPNAMSDFDKITAAYFNMNRQ